MKKVTLIIAIAMLLTAAGFANEELETDTATILPRHPAPVVQMAILLDTSGSMSGLIDQARVELWAIVNEFIYARQNSIAPQVQVALFEYGKDTVPAKDGYVRLITDFTTDLDKVSEELFKLKTNGGSEYCGWVIDDAVKKLKWSKKPNDLKVIFIAGNEAFTQGQVDYRKSCKSAIENGIIVNTIHCGGEKQGIDGKWKDGAVLADGKFLNIDQNRQIVYIEAPQDKKIAELNGQLNKTYVAYGVNADAFVSRQTVQDKNAAGLSKQAELQRAVTKSSLNYSNSNWDMVDAVKRDNKKITDFKDVELPEEMRKMTDEEKIAYVDDMAKKRTEIQIQIQNLNVERQKYIVAQNKKLQNDGEDTLGSAIQKAVQEQAKTKNFDFVKKGSEK